MKTEFELELHGSANRWVTRTRDGSFHLEQVVEIISRQSLCSAGVFTEHGSHEILLLLLELQDLFFDRAGGDEAVNRDDLLLADAVSAIGGLVFDGGVPPGVEVDHGVRRGEVETGTAGLETDQEHRDRRIVLEALDALLAVHRAAVQVFVTDLVFVERFAHELQHRDELAEYEHLVTAGLRFVDELPERREFTAVDVIEFTWQPEQTRVAGGLSEFGQASQNVELALGDPLALDLTHDLRADL